MLREPSELALCGSQTKSRKTWGFTGENEPNSLDLLTRTPFQHGYFPGLRNKTHISICRIT